MRYARIRMSTTSTNQPKGLFRNASKTPWTLSTISRSITGDTLQMLYTYPRVFNDLRDAVKGSGDLEGVPGRGRFVRPDDLGSRERGEDLGGQGRGPALTDGTAGELAEERFPGDAGQDRRLERPQSPQVSKDGDVVLRSLPEPDPRIDDDSRRRDACLPCRADPLRQLQEHLEDHVLEGGRLLHRLR